MTTVKEIKELLLTAINNMHVFNDVYINYIPPPNKVNRFPAIAIDFMSTSFDRFNHCIFDVESYIDFYIYNRPPTTGTDILDIISQLDRVIQTDNALQSKIIDGYVTEIVSDGGVVNPIEVYKVTVKLQYRITNTN